MSKDFDAMAWGDRITDEQLDELLERAKDYHTVKLRIDQFRDLVRQAKSAEQPHIEPNILDARLAWLRHRATLTNLPYPSRDEMAAFHDGFLAARSHSAPPFVPTEAMLIAARDWSLAKYGQGVGNEGAIGCWQAMYAALYGAAPLSATVTPEQFAKVLKAIVVNMGGHTINVSQRAAWHTFMVLLERTTDYSCGFGPMPREGNSATLDVRGAGKKP